MTPEKKARVNIDTLLVQAGWHVCDMADAIRNLAPIYANPPNPLDPRPRPAPGH